MSKPAEVHDFDETYREQKARVLRLCRLLLADPHEADDVSQDVFFKFFREVEMGRTVNASGPWLHKVTVNACRDRRRSAWWKRRESESRPFEESEFTHGDATPEEQLFAGERRAAIWKVFRHLPIRQREVLALRLVEGCPTEESARILGLAPGSVKRHLFRAIRRMRRDLRGAS